LVKLGLVHLFAKVPRHQKAAKWSFRSQVKLS